MSDTTTEKLSKEQIIASLKVLNLAELTELITAIETEFNVSANLAAMTSPSEQPTTKKAAEPTEVNVVINDVGANKVGVIKLVRDFLSIGLMDAKKMVDAPTPITLKEKLPIEDAKTIIEKLKEVGATVSTA